MKCVCLCVSGPCAAARSVSVLQCGWRRTETSCCFYFLPLQDTARCEMLQQLNKPKVEQNRLTCKKEEISAVCVLVGDFFYELKEFILLSVNVTILHSRSKQHFIFYNCSSDCRPRLGTYFWRLCVTEGIFAGV